MCLKGIQLQCFANFVEYLVKGNGFVGLYRESTKSLTRDIAPRMYT